MHEKKAGETPSPAAVVLIYAELAERLGIGREAARLQAKRQRWEVLPDGGGIARVGVPAEEPPAARVGHRRLPSLRRCCAWLYAYRDRSKADVPACCRGIFWNTRACCSGLR